MRPNDAITSMVIQGLIDILLCKECSVCIRASIDVHDEMGLWWVMFNEYMFHTKLALLYSAL
jgi:hypothetical protein